MKKFKELENAVRYALDHHYDEPFEFMCNGVHYETERVCRFWAVSLCPHLYYELYDEEPEHEIEEFDSSYDYYDF